MEMQQLRQLIEAGLTDEQIKNVFKIMSPSAGAGTNPDPKPAPSPDPKPDPDALKNVPADASKNEQPPAAKTDIKPDAETAENETQKMIKEMLGIMQKGYINTLQQNTQKTQTAEEIIASVLNP